MNAADQAYSLILPEKRAQHHYEEVKRILREVKAIALSSNDVNRSDTKTTLLQEAINHIRKGITLASRDIKYYLIAADVYEELLDNSSACAHLRYALNVIGVDSSMYPFGFEKDMKDRLADLLFRRARGWMECGNSVMAIESLTEATSLKPTEPKAWLLMAMAKLQLSSMDKRKGNEKNEVSKDQLKEVLGYLDKALEFGRECQAYILRGKVNWALGQTDAGNRDFRNAAMLDPGHPEVLIFQNDMFSEAGILYNDAKKFVEENDLERAVNCLTSAIKAAPEDVRLVVMRASVLRRMGCIEDSFLDLDRASRMYFVARYNYKDPNKHASDEEKSIELTKCMEKYPEHRREPLEVTRQRNLTSNELALDLMIQNDHRKALTILNKIIKSEMALAVAADAKNAMAKTSHLKTANQQALEVMGPTDTSNSATASTLGSIMKSSDLSSYGVDVRFLINRGDCHRALGTLDAALHDFHAALEANQGNWDVKTRISLVYYQRGVEYFNQCEYVQSILAFSKAIDLNPQVATYFASRGESQYQCQRFSGAYQDFKTALELDPNLTHILDRYRQLEPNLSTLKSVVMKRDPNLPFGNLLQHSTETSSLVVSNSRKNQVDLLFKTTSRRKDLRRNREKFNGGQDKVVYASSQTNTDPRITFPMVSPSKQKKIVKNKVGRYRNSDSSVGSHSSSVSRRKSENEIGISSTDQTHEHSDMSASSQMSSPIRENSKKWIKFKSDAKNADGSGSTAATSHRSYQSKAIRQDDGELKFVWKSTQNIQREEEQKRELFRLKLKDNQRVQSEHSNLSLPQLYPPATLESNESRRDTANSSEGSASCRVVMTSKAINSQGDGHIQDQGMYSLHSQPKDISFNRGQGVSRNLPLYAETTNLRYQSGLSGERGQAVAQSRLKAMSDMMDHLDSPGSPKLCM